MKEEKKSGELEPTISDVLGAVQKLTGRFDTLEASNQKLSGRFDTLEASNQKLAGRFDTLEDKFDSLKETT
jgi:predicted nuclease with TOPRIM domain